MKSTGINTVEHLLFLLIIISSVVAHGMDLEKAYKILQVSPVASDSEVKSAYRQRAKELHPDMEPLNDQAAKEKAIRLFTELSNAFTKIVEERKEPTEESHKSAELKAFIQRYNLSMYQMFDSDLKPYLPIARGFVQNLQRGQLESYQNVSVWSDPIFRAILITEMAEATYSPLIEDFIIYGAQLGDPKIRYEIINTFIFKQGFTYAKTPHLVLALLDAEPSLRESARIINRALTTEEIVHNISDWITGLENKRWNPAIAHTLTIKLLKDLEKDSAGIITSAIDQILPFIHKQKLSKDLTLVDIFFEYGSIQGSPILLRKLINAIDFEQFSLHELENLAIFYSTTKIRITLEELILSNHPGLLDQLANFQPKSPFLGPKTNSIIKEYKDRSKRALTKKNSLKRRKFLLETSLPATRSRHKKMDTRKCSLSLSL